jgi:hypothetical protein
MIYYYYFVDVRKKAILLIKCENSDLEFHIEYEDMFDEIVEQIIAMNQGWA